MSPFRKSLLGLLHALPAIIIVTLVEVSICYGLGGLVMLELMPTWGRTYPHLVLWVAVLVAVVTQLWLLFNHKIREYIKSRSME